VLLRFVTQTFNRKTNRSLPISNGFSHPKQPTLRPSMTRLYVKINYMLKSTTLQDTEQRPNTDMTEVHTAPLSPSPLPSFTFYPSSSLHTSKKHALSVSTQCPWCAMKCVHVVNSHQHAHAPYTSHHLAAPCQGGHAGHPPCLHMHQL